jgi:hypothetical protein
VADAPNPTAALETFGSRVARRHEEECARGLHDEQCEFRPRGFWICNCSKRRREAEGFIEPPAEELHFPPPACPRCDVDLDHDGDGWQCYSCHLSWRHDGSHCEFTDDYGDDLAERVALWDARQARTATDNHHDHEDRGARGMTERSQ